jgi:phosphoribosyl-AMP cyclohydrolase
MSKVFPVAANAGELEAGARFTPRFGLDGLIPCIATDADSGKVVMFAHMNEEALALSIETKVAHYWSRSRGKLWRKGESSHHEQAIVEMRVDCDQDVIWIIVRTGGTGASCHTGRLSCFYRAVPLGEKPSPEMTLRFVDADLLFDPGKVYGS